MSAVRDWRYAIGPSRTAPSGLRKMESPRLGVRLREAQAECAGHQLERPLKQEEDEDEDRLWEREQAGFEARSEAEKTNIALKLSDCCVPELKFARGILRLNLGSSAILLLQSYN